MASYRKMLLPLTLLGLLAGCASTSVTGEGGKTLTLLRPANQSLVRGQTNKILITVRRDEFAGPIEIEFQDLPDGVRIVEESTTVPAGDTFQNFTLYVAPDAEGTENHTVTVVATSPDGLQAVERFQIDIS